MIIRNLTIFTLLLVTNISAAELVTIPECTMFIENTIHENELGNTVRFGDELIRIPKFLALESYGNDPDNKGVDFARLYSEKPNAPLLALIFRNAYSTIIPNYRQEKEEITCFSEFGKYQFYVVERIPSKLNSAVLQTKHFKLMGIGLKAQWYVQYFLNQLESSNEERTEKIQKASEKLGEIAGKK